MIEILTYRSRLNLVTIKFSFEEVQKILRDKASETIQGWDRFVTDSSSVKFYEISDFYGPVYSEQCTPFSYVEIEV